MNSFVLINHLPSSPIWIHHCMIARIPWTATVDGTFQNKPVISWGTRTLDMSWWLWKAPDWSVKFTSARYFPPSPTVTSSISIPGSFISERVQATLDLELFVYSRVGIKLTSGESCNENIFLPAFVPGHRGTFDRVEIELKLDAVDWIVVRYGTSRVRTWFGCQLSCEQMQSIIACQSWKNSAILHYITLHNIALHYITLSAFKRHLHLQWPVVHQQLYVIRNTAHRPSTQASYTASQVRPKRKISCAAAQIAATLTISFPRWRHMSLSSYWGQQRMTLTSYPGP